MVSVVFLLLLVITSFLAGMAFLIIGKYMFRPDSQNIFVQCLAFIRGKAGYLASFGAGAFLVAVLGFLSNPYYLYSWSSAYDDWVLGSLINSDETILQTGQIPQDIIDWYAAHHKG